MPGPRRHRKLKQEHSQFFASTMTMTITIIMNKPPFTNPRLFFFVVFTTLLFVTSCAWQQNPATHPRIGAAKQQRPFPTFLLQETSGGAPEDDAEPPQQQKQPRKSVYNLGETKNRPFLNKEDDHQDDDDSFDPAQNWIVPDPVQKPPLSPSQAAGAVATARQSVAAADSVVHSKEERHHHPPKQQQPNNAEDQQQQQQQQLVMMSPNQQEPIRTRRMVARDNASQRLRAALWDEYHYGKSSFATETAMNNAAAAAYERAPQEEEEENEITATTSTATATATTTTAAGSYTTSKMMSPSPPTKFYPDIDLSIPDSVYKDDGSVDLVWDLLRWEAYQEAQREPLLVSFLYSTILNHNSLESSLAFLLANRLQSPAMMISTQLQSLILESLQDPFFRRSLRADMMAVRDRDPACHCLPDVFLYFKGFHALQSYRVAHTLFCANKTVLARYLQSQVSQIFQIDIHPNATLKSGIMLDHGTG